MAVSMTKEVAEQLLELSGTYDRKQVDAAFRTQQKKYHPDAALSRGMSAQEAAERSKQVNMAYACLKVLLRNNVTLTVGVGATAMAPQGQSASRPSGSNGADPYSGYRGGASTPHAGTATSTSYTSTAGTPTSTESSHKYREMTDEEFEAEMRREAGAYRETGFDRVIDIVTGVLEHLPLRIVTTLLACWWFYDSFFGPNSADLIYHVFLGPIGMLALLIFQLLLIGIEALSGIVAMMLKLLVIGILRGIAHVVRTIKGKRELNGESGLGFIAFVENLGAYVRRIFKSLTSRFKRS